MSTLGSTANAGGLQKDGKSRRLLTAAQRAALASQTLVELHPAGSSTLITSPSSSASASSSSNSALADHTPSTLPPQQSHLANRTHTRLQIAVSGGGYSIPSLTTATSTSPTSAAPMLAQPRGFGSPTSGESGWCMLSLDEFGGQGKERGGGGDGTRRRRGRKRV